MATPASRSRLVSLGIVAAILMSILGIRMWFLQSVKLELNEDIV